MSRKPPHPNVLANLLEDAAKRVRRDGPTALRLAPELASRGYPSSTLGDGGSRGTDPTSAVEREVLHGETRWEHIDRHLNARMSYCFLVTVRMLETLQEVTAHAGDDDRLPAGSGTCERCARVVRSDMKQGDRLRSGYCNACYTAWIRAARPDRHTYNHTHKEAS